MGADQVQDNVDLQFNVNDAEAARRIGVIAGASTRLGESLKSTFGILTAAGGIAGVFAIGSTVQGINQTYQAVARVRAVTGMTADNAHAMLDAFELSGVEAQIGERLITQMSRKSQQLEQGIAGANEQSKKLNDYYKKLGVNMKSGPMTVLQQMAGAAEKGKLSVSDLISKFGVPIRQSAQVMRMLQKGPEGIKKIIDDTKGGADIIDEQALANFEEMQQTSRNLKDSWEGLIGSVYKNLIPGITRVMNMVADGLNSWTPLVARFAGFLEAHMTKIVAMAKMYAIYMTANKVLGAVGVSGGVKGVVGGINKYVGGAGEKIVGGLGGGLIKGVLGGQGGPFGAIINFLAKMTGGVGRLAAVGGALFAVIGLIYVILKNTSGATDRLKAGFGKVWEAIQRVRASLEIIFSPTAPLGKFLQVVGNSLVWVFERVLQIIELITDGIATIMLMLANVFGKHGMVGGFKYLAQHGVGESLMDADREITAKRQRERAMEASEGALKVHGNLNKTIAQIIAGSKAQVIQDFRGSRFDIKQQFAEGFDQDRIAAVFGNDLVKASERRLQSGFSPIFGVR